mmetsp:Transcript_49299/g.123239  ORF Transcript_49299/g.123239 Transcript_49299/m.123239 type:complete len:399 (+) Transcript_49299:368-1564(+)
MSNGPFRVLALLHSFRFLHRRHVAKVVQEQRNNNREQHPADNNNVGGEEEGDPVVHRPVLVEKLPRERLPALESRDLEHREERVEKRLKRNCPVSEELDAQDGVDAHDEEDDEERVDDGDEGGSEGIDDAALGAEPPKQPQHPEGPQQPQHAEAGKAPDGESDEGYGDDDKVKGVPAVGPEGGTPVGKEVDGELDGECDGEDGLHGGEDLLLVTARLRAYLGLHGVHDEVCEDEDGDKGLYGPHAVEASEVALDDPPRLERLLGLNDSIPDQAVEQLDGDAELLLPLGLQHVRPAAVVPPLDRYQRHGVVLDLNLLHLVQRHTVQHLRLPDLGEQDVVLGHDDPPLLPQLPRAHLVHDLVHDPLLRGRELATDHVEADGHGVEPLLGLPPPRVRKVSA